MIEKDTISRHLGKASRTMAALGALNVATLGCSDEVATPRPRIENLEIIKNLSQETKTQLIASLQNYCNALTELDGKPNNEKIETLKAEIDARLPSTISFNGHTEITPYTCFVSFAESPNIQVQHVVKNVPAELLEKLDPLEKEFIGSYHHYERNRRNPALKTLLNKRDDLVRMYADQCGLAMTATWNFPNKENGSHLQFVYVGLEKTSPEKTKPRHNSPMDCKKTSNVPFKS